MASTGAERAASQGLRELKKQRTRETIVRVGMELFSQHGFQATTLIEIAAAAEIVPSTLYSYYPTKRDIVFDRQTTILESAKSRLLNRLQSESTISALQGWVSVDLPGLSDSASEIQRRREIIDANEELLTEERLRFALLEDVFAEAFAQDLGETADDLRSRLLAAVAIAGLRAIWRWSFTHPHDGTFKARDAYKLDSTYLTKMLSAAETAIQQIPRPPTGHAGEAQ